MSATHETQHSTSARLDDPGSAATDGPSGGTLTVDKVTKSYRDRVALDSVSFEVVPGLLTGFVGANGSGKTTTMRIIMGVLADDGGTVTLGGVPVTAEDRRRFGYMPEERGLYPKMKVGEQVSYLGRLHGMSGAEADSSTEALLERLGLAERAGDTVESLSLGNQQRAQIAAALVHRPTLLILDEPFSGLDPLAVETVLGVLKDAAAEGAPVLFSSHQLDIVERLCDRLVIISDGRIRASGTRQELRASHDPNHFELAVDGDVGWLREHPGVRVLEIDGGDAVFEADDADAAQSVLARAAGLGRVRRFAPQHPSLAQIFQEVVR